MASEHGSCTLAGSTATADSHKLDQLCRQHLRIYLDAGLQLENLPWTAAAPAAPAPAPTPAADREDAPGRRRRTSRVPQRFR